MSARFAASIRAQHSGVSRRRANRSKKALMAWSDTVDITLNAACARSIATAAACWSATGINNSSPLTCSTNRWSPGWKRAASSGLTTVTRLPAKGIGVPATRRSSARDMKRYHHAKGGRKMYSKSPRASSAAPIAQDNCPVLYLVTYQSVYSPTPDTPRLHFPAQTTHRRYTRLMKYVSTGPPPPDFPASKEINHERHYFIGRQRPAPEP
ncbi:hypothetical protein D3C73_955170 [compost metagenome]